jgi:L-serine dehydratase
MGPLRAAQLFKLRFPDAACYQVTLYGSLAATGKGHLTDVAIESTLQTASTSIIWKPEVILPRHPNGMDFEALDSAGHAFGRMRMYSVGGGALQVEGESQEAQAQVYPLSSMASILKWCDENGEPLWRYVERCEGSDIWAYLEEVGQAMMKAIDHGLGAEGVLPGELKLARKSRSYLAKARRCHDSFQRTGLLSAYALAVAEENAAGQRVVTAPTCGSCGVLPAVLRYTREITGATQEEMLRSLAVAGLIGNLVKTNASISGAEVGCQGEIGTACAMAAGAAAQVLGATNYQIEYAAEMGLEHHLGLTCDPVGGLVQIPCIERNAFAATRALDCADYALLSDGKHRVSFDEVTVTMRETGRDLCSAYRETAAGGLAIHWKR